MFEKLNDVDWENLKQAHGNARHVPEAIKGLVSNDPEIREASYWKLDNYVVLQSDLYEAAFYIIPFLVEILKSDILFGRNYVYDLLFEIANGYASEDLLCVYGNKEVPLKDACRNAIANEIELYLFEVRNSSSKFRLDALGLLISLDEYEEKIIPELAEILKHEDSSEFEVELRKSISELKS